MIHLGLIGCPVRHSLSPRLFEEKFQRLGIEGDYRLFELPTLDGLPTLVEQSMLDGFNVTSPYKQQVITFLDELSDNARRVGAVNTVVVGRKGGALALKGYNTDVEGFRRSICSLLQPHHRSALVFGNGGASRAVCVALQQLGIAHVVVARRPETGQLPWQQLSAELIAEHHVLINCTTIGMADQNGVALPIDYVAVTPRHLAFDLIYNPLTTPFLLQCQRKGATIANGLSMLRGQAEAAWQLWCNR